MTFTSKFNRALLRSGSAFSAIAMLGAGVGGFVAAPAMAQDIASAELSGLVQDEQGNPVSGATVVLSSSERGLTRTATTGPSGAYTFRGLPIGTYDLSVNASGFAPAKVQAAEARLGGAAYTVTLAPEAADGQTIVVTGRSVQSLDFSQTATGAVFDVQEVAERVPVPRTLEAIALLAPQTVQGDASFSADYPNGTIALGGSSIAENIYYINGMNVTNFRTFIGGSTVPFEFYDQVQVKTGGYQAEFGRSTGGALIAVSRSGTNELRGGANVYWSPSGLRAKQPNTYAADNSKDRVTNLEGNVWLSGPIIKNRLYAFAFFNPRHDVSYGEDINNASSFRIASDTPFYGGKIDADIFDGHRLEFTYFNDSNTEKTVNRNLENGVTTRYSTEQRYTGGENYIARYTGQFADWLTFSALYGKSKYERRLTGSDASAPYTVDINYTNQSGPIIELAGIGDTLDNGRDQREQYRADVDIFANLLGDHHIRFGVDYEKLNAENVSAYSGGEINYFYRNYTSAPIFNASGNGIQPGEGYLRRIVYTTGGKFENQNTAFYVQDNWDITDRLQLSLGLRNDRFRNFGNGGIEFVDLKNQWAPRLGATFDVTGDRRTRLSAFFGRYYLPVAANTNLRMAGTENYYQEYYRFTGIPGNATPVGAPLARTVFSDASTPDPTTLVSKNLKPQYMDEFIVGAQRRIGSQWKVGINVTHRNLKNVLEDSDLDQYAIGAYCATQNLPGCNANEAPSVGSGGYVLLNPGKDVIINVAPDGNFAGGELTIPAQFVDLPKGKRKYWGVELSFDREWDGRWSLSGSYTWSKLKGNYEGGVKSDTAQDDVGLTQDFDEPAWMDGSYGYLPNDRRHSFKLYGAYAVTDNFSVGVNARVTSGRAYGCLGIYPFEDGRGQDPYNDGGADSWYCGDRAHLLDTDNDGTPDAAQGTVLVGRGGAFRGAWEKRVDLNFAYRVPVGAFRNVQLRADIFNVFNFDKPIDYNEVGDLATVIGAGNVVPINPNYGKPTNYQTPRYVRFGASVEF